MKDEPHPTPAPDDDAADDDDLSVSGLGASDTEQRPTRLSAAGLRSLRRLWRASGVVALVALIAIVAVAVAPHLPHPEAPRYTPPYTALLVSSNVARCLTGASWSHNSQRIAAVESTTCAAPYLGGGPAHPNLFIFDSATGGTVATYDLDDAVNAALGRVGVATSSGLNYAIIYYETDWSPDGRQLAVPFAIYGEQMGYAGTAIVTLSGPARGQVAAMLSALGATDAAPSNGFDVAPVKRWDITRGAVSTVYLAPALAYRWLPGDVLVADEPLAANTTTPGASAASGAASGDPIGGQAFSMWRQGGISPVTATACGGNGVVIQPLTAPYAYLTLSATIWSPDGRYLLSASAQARLPSDTGRPVAARAGQSPCDSGPAPDQLPAVTPPDRGLRSALGLLDAEGGNQLSLAWSPDGQKLAVGAYTITQGAGSVMIYDCASGALLRRFTGDQFEAGYAASEVAHNPVWSPDSSRLLLSVDGPVAKLVILGPLALGA